ncbi:MAG: hypothetical protein ACK5CT_01405 [Bacteroidota bacterium]
MEPKTMCWKVMNTGKLGGTCIEMKNERSLSRTEKVEWAELN